MSASRAYQKAIAAALEADPAVAALVGARIYDNPPKDPAFPHVVLGATDFVPTDEECIDGREETIQIDVWARNDGKLHPCKAVVDAVYGALHQVTLALDDPYANVETNVTLVRVFADADGITAHGVVQVTAMIETP
jgi:hypothetical protein